MLLAIDCGNTNTVFALCDGDRVAESWRMRTRPDRTADEYAVWLIQCMGLRGFRPAHVTGAIVATVVPPTRFELARLVAKYFPVPLLDMGDPAVDPGIRVVLDRPEQVGVDRLANAVGAFVTHGGDVIVLDFGTSTSFDFVDAAGNFTGSILAPGVNLSIEALYQAASQLPRISLRRPERVIGKATVPAMEAGVYWGYVSMIEGLVARATAELGKDMTVIATGGLAPLFLDATDAFSLVDPDLTLRGLIEIHRRNRPG